MCGIVAYIGKNNCSNNILDKLSHLEYRGYDSAGVCYVCGPEFKVYKSVGPVESLKKEVGSSLLRSYCAISHTRWATHGQPSVNNCHPHVTEDRRLSLVHNGIIENYKDLKAELSKKYNFSSDTDSEVLLYLVYDIMILNNLSLFEAVKLALEQVMGAYAIVIVDKDNPNTLVCARKGSSLIVGVGDQEYYVSSDKMGIDENITDLIYLKDNNICQIGDQIITYDMTCGVEVDCEIEKVLDHRMPSDKGAYDSYMLKEINEQPDTIAQCFSGRLFKDSIRLGGLLGYEKILASANHITIVACGSSWNAGLLGKYYIEELNNIKVSVEYASEFKYRTTAIGPGDIVIGISQSGETADTLSALEKAKAQGATIIGICNVPNSTMARMTDCGIFLRSGVEIGVASTKTFLNQVLVLLLLSLWINQNQENSNTNIRKNLISNILQLPYLIKKTLSDSDQLIQTVEKYKSIKNCLFLGRGYNFPIALEGALKLKEISYIHAEGYAAAEMKHGPLALVDKDTPTLVIANNMDQYQKLQNNIQEIKARNGPVILLGSQEHCDILVPSTIDQLSPLLSVIPLQLLAYYYAIKLNLNVDKPRNLAKSVTVE
jgi:glucosamine--fructose-6-phosphate aminotransferase (isomerizing)